MPLAALPTVEQVRQLPKLLTKIIPPEYEDANGHVNIQHYLGLYDEAGWPFVALLGLGQQYIEQERSGLFDLEHHLRYLAELHVGDTVSVYGRMLGRSAKRMHGIWFILNANREQVSNNFEFVSSHADLEARRTSPFPEAITAKLDAMIAEHQALSWAAPTCGIMAP